MALHSENLAAPHHFLVAPERHKGAACPGAASVVVFGVGMVGAWGVNPGITIVHGAGAWPSSAAACSHALRP